MKPEKQTNKHQIQKLLKLTRGDAAPENHQVSAESLETFQASYASSTVKNENDTIGFLMTLAISAFLNQNPNKQTSHE